MKRLDLSEKRLHEIADDYATRRIDYLDCRRSPNAAESKIINTCIYGAISEIASHIIISGGDVKTENERLVSNEYDTFAQASKDTAENIAKGLVPNVNCYEAIYIPIQDTYEMFKKEARKELEKKSIGRE